jgi:hypothetical protein
VLLSLDVVYMHSIGGYREEANVLLTKDCLHSKLKA